MMTRVFALILFLCPLLAFADASLSFTPPTTDISVIYLSNLFGVVDGVLHGTGSQILGTMFGVFNSAVIALGGIIIMYTLIVSTMNTAHEGQFLGQKWSSIWVPVRSVVGIALLMPKASGYCMIQIFVMWVCVQGVGAADKIWNAALDYLNRGGVIVKPQMTMDKPALGSTGGSAGIYKGAAAILEGQVCMLAIQQRLTEFRKEQLEQKTKRQGYCFEPSDPEVKAFCDKSVPDFLATVDTSEPSSQWSDKYNKALEAFGPATQDYHMREYEVMRTGTPAEVKAFLREVKPAPPQMKELISAPMPNFKEDVAPYNRLNGLCGIIKWNSFVPGANLEQIGLTKDDEETLSMTRAIAVQQLYNTIGMISQAIVNNIKVEKVPGSSVPIISVADQFGVPLNMTGSPCTAANEDNCVSWGPQASGTDINKPVLFRGTELVGAVLDYMAVMEPSLRVQSQAQNVKGNEGHAAAARSFIGQAKQEGWLMAGSYFFKLALLNQIAMDSGGNSQKDDSGLDKSEDLSGMFALNIKEIKEYLVKVNVCESGSDDNNTCPAILEIRTIFANNDDSKLSSAKIFDVIERPKPQTDDFANTVWGFIQNSLMLKQAEQVMPKTKFTMNFNFAIKPEFPGVGNLGDVSCGNSSSYVGCIVRAFVTIIFKVIFETVIPNLMAILAIIIDQIIVTVLQGPLILVGNIFLSAVSAIQNPLTNPIVALANMGVLYINAAVEIWIYVMGIAIAVAANPFFAAPLAFIMMMITPLLGTWVGIMTGVGFLTAYYVPFIPFMVFSFGVIGWLIAVIESMVAAPIVALGISSPEGDQALGKAEHAIMLLMNVFLRPGMMVIGYIAAIALSYVAVWVINAGFVNAVQFIQGAQSTIADALPQKTQYTDPSELAKKSKTAGGSWSTNESGPLTGIDILDDSIGIALLGKDTASELASSTIEEKCAWLRSSKLTLPPECEGVQQPGGNVLEAVIEELKRQEAVKNGWASIIEMAKKGQDGRETPQPVAPPKPVVDRNTAPVSFAQMMSGYIPTPPSLSEHLQYGHVGWAGVFGLFFSILTYTWIYWGVVQESFNLVAILPDKILRWIGGQQESIGQETLKWGDQTKDQIGQAGGKTLDAVAKSGAQAKEGLDKKAADKTKGVSVQSEGGSTPPPAG